ncbi:TPA: hypothetical protein ACH3X2_009200 [Trebouxia sp. C0005]
MAEGCVCCAGCSQRVLVYCWWAFNTAVCAAFSALAIVNCRHMTDTTLYGGGTDAQVTLSGVIIACILGIVMVLVYSVISLLLVMRNIFSRRPLAGFWYGVLLSSSLHVAMFMLLAALVLTSFNSAIDRGVNDSVFPLEWSSVYKVTFALAYLLVATFLVQFFLFWLCKSAFIDGPTTAVVVESRTPSANATVAVIRKDDIKNAKKAAKAAQKAAELNKMFGAGQAETIV